MKRLEVDPNLVLGPIEAADADEALLEIAKHFVNLGYAKESYPQAVVEREHEFPTGLPTNGVGVAVPHCDAVHVINSAIAVVTLKNPLRFGVMGSKDDTVLVDIVFMLAIKEPSSQIDTLRKLSLLVQDSAMLERLRDATGKEEVIGLLDEGFKFKAV